MPSGITADGHGAAGADEPGSADDKLPGNSAGEVPHDGTPGGAGPSSGAPADQPGHGTAPESALPGGPPAAREEPGESPGDQAPGDEADPSEGPAARRPPGVIYDAAGREVTDPDQGTGQAGGSCDTIAAELAGWAAGELPGQASARLAAWASVGGVPTGYRAGDGPASPGASL